MVYGLWFMGPGFPNVSLFFDFNDPLLSRSLSKKKVPLRKEGPLI
jgi:hypothetical protein